MRSTSLTPREKFAIVLATAMVAALSWFLYFGPHMGEMGIAGSTQMTPNGRSPSDVALSPDGNSVAILYVDLDQRQKTYRYEVEVRDAISGRQVADIPLASTAGSSRNSPVAYLGVRYCGRYLVALSHDTMYVLNPQTLAIHKAFPQDGLLPEDVKQREFRLGAQGAHAPIRCPTQENIAVFSLQYSILLIDLESGKPIGPAEPISDYGYAMAVSPDGSQLATTEYRGREGTTINVVGTHPGIFPSTLVLKDDMYNDRHVLAFAGENALVIGDGSCQVRENCDSTPHKRSFRLWDWNTNTQKPLGEPGAEAYRIVVGSTDGKTVLGYTGKESICKDCNDHSGELKLDDIRFTLWDTASGKPVAHSRQLATIRYKCSPFQIIGNCTEYESSPELQMSSDGRTILVFWRPADPQDAKATGTIEVFRRS